MPRSPKESRTGFILYQELMEAFEKNDLNHRVEIKPAECLSICPRPCGIALSSDAAWTYLFGDQSPGVTTDQIVDCISTYLDSQNGYMPRANRPIALRASILGRVPPIQRGNPCT